MELERIQYFFDGVLEVIDIQFSLCSVELSWKMKNEWSHIWSILQPSWLHVDFLFYHYAFTHRLIKTVITCFEAPFSWHFQSGWFVDTAMLPILMLSSASSAALLWATLRYLTLHDATWRYLELLFDYFGCLILLEAKSRYFMLTEIYDAILRYITLPSATTLLSAFLRYFTNSGPNWSCLIQSDFIWLFLTLFEAI